MAFDYQKFGAVPVNQGSSNTSLFGSKKTDFNPAQFGATPVKKPFNPSDFGATLVTQNDQQPPQQKNDFFKGSDNAKSLNPLTTRGASVVNAVTKTEQNFGQDIGQGLYLMFGGQDKISKQTQSYLDNAATLLGLAKKQTDSSRKSTLLFEARNNIADAQKVGGNIIGRTRTPEQIVGDALGTATDVLGAGSYGKEASAMKSFQLAPKILPGAAEAAVQAGKDSTGFLPGFLKGAKAAAPYGAAFGASQGASQALQENKNATDVAKQSVINSIEGAGVTAVTGGMISGAESGLATRRAGGSFFGGKIIQEVLNTPEQDVYKLNSAERPQWYANQEKQIRSQTETATSEVQSQSEINKANIESSRGITQQQISEDLQKQIDTTTKTSDDLNKQLSQSSNERVNELRPKIRQAMTQQSKTYRELVSDAMKGKENIPITKSELSRFIDEHSDNPESAAIVKSKLGVSGTGRGGKTTLGDVYDNLTSLKQEVRRPILKGTQVFNAEDLNTDKAIRTLSQFMQSKGVDFSEANQFWAKYAPIRDQWVSDFRPFNQAGTQTGRGANVLINSAKGTDFKNTNFIKQTEDLIGEPLASDQKAIIEKMSQNEKTALANKIDAATKSANADLLAKQQLESEKIQTELKTKKITDSQASKLDALNSKKFEIEKKAMIRGITKKILITVASSALGIEADRAVKKYTGFGF